MFGMLFGSVAGKIPYEAKIQEVVAFDRFLNVDILARAKRKIVDFQAARIRKPLSIEESTGPFRYEYISVSHVLGAKLPDGSPDPLQVAEFPDMNATAYLTHDWDKQYFHIDRADSVATLLLTGLVGVKRFKKVSRIVDRFLRGIFGPERVFMRNLEVQATRNREKRLKEHPGYGCCFVYRAGGQVDQSLNLRASRRFSEVGVALDAFDESVIREEHKLSVRSVATAVSIAMTDTNGSPEIRFLADNVHLLGIDLRSRIQNFRRMLFSHFFEST